MKVKIITISMVFTVIFGAGIYTAFASSPNPIKKSVEKPKETVRQDEEEIMKKTADKFGISTEGKPKEQIQKEISVVRSEKRQELLREHAKELGIDVEGKTDEQLIQEIGKIQSKK
ncbi:hypothetical protein SAMN04488168_10116 [Bacillus sp. 491mf]|uniref:hypothetical protein n=1 Tax=Bacillus TaxID=1386 RepID=UPI00054FB8DA|nr:MULTISPECIES: hypothetical protein [unclassified Bacillus (in: firmicutes)]SFB88834.1 hypothetical protein SAMN04488168_10116 [Bacillus sp. 491mf]